MARLIGTEVKGYKIDLITKLMEKGITQFEIDTNDTIWGLRIIVKQAIKPDYTKEVAKYFSKLDYVEYVEMCMCPRPGNNEHLEAVLLIDIKRKLYE